MNKAGGRHHFRWQIKAQSLSRHTPFALASRQTEQRLIEHLAGHGRAVTWRTTLIGLTVTPTHTSAAVALHRRHNAHDLRPMGGRRRGARSPRAPCPRHRLQWLYLQPDRAVGRRGTRGTHRRTPPDGHPPPEPDERRFRRHLRPRQRPPPTLGRSLAGLHRSKQPGEISHEAYAEVASTEIQQWLAEDATQRRTVGNIRSVFTDLDRLPTQPRRRP